MPYSNFPKDIPTDKIDSCVHDVMAKGNPKPAAIAICYDSLVKGKELLRAIKEYAATKETGPASDYLIVEDAEQPSTYHLRVKVDGKPDHTLMGAAWAALHSGYRGNVYEGPGKQEAIAKLKRLYDEEKMPIPSEKGILFIADDAELSEEELQAVERLYQDIGAGRVALESLAEPDAVTGKANVPVRGGSPGGSPGGNPGGSNQGGSQGSHADKQERCYLQVKKLGGDEATARKICRSIFGGRPGIKQARGDASFAVYKQADGAYRWLAVTSSSFQDRDKEIVSQKALEADTERMNTTGDFGALDWWHTPIVLGACDFSAMHGRLSVESGTFRDAWIATKFAEAKDGFEMSRAFYHPITEPDPEGVYHNIKTFSRAIIPQGIGKASNLLTTFTVIKEEKEMLMDKVKELVNKLGGDKQAEEKVNALLAEAEAKEKAAEVAGIAAKEKKPEVAPEAKPEPEKAKEAPILEQPGMFIADMKPEEFSALMTKAMGDSQMAIMAQMAEMMAQMQTMMKAMLGEAAMEQAKEIAALATKQAALETQVKELNGLTPRGYRATQDPATATNKDAKPAADEKANYFSQFVNGFVLGQPQPPVK